MSGMRWKGSGKVATDKYTIIYSGGDYHGKGVGPLFDKNAVKSICSYLSISDRFIMVKLKGKPLNIIQVHAQTTNSSEKEVQF